MRLIAKVIRISLAKFHCNRHRAVQDIQDYASLIFVNSFAVFDLPVVTSRLW